MPRKKTTKKKTSSPKKPIGFTKVGKSYVLVYGTRTKPRLGKKKYGSKKTLSAAVNKIIRKK